MSAIYRLTLRQLAGRWRLRILTVLSALPVPITAMVLSFDRTPSVVEFEEGVLSRMVAGPFVLASGLLTGDIAYVGDLRSTFALTAGLVTCLVLYASVFTWLGLVTTQAIGIGLLYILVWEGLFAGFNWLTLRRLRTMDVP